MLVLVMDSTEGSVDKLQRELRCIRKNISKLVTETKNVCDRELTSVVFDEKKVEFENSIKNFNKVTNELLKLLAVDDESNESAIGFLEDGQMIVGHQIKEFMVLEPVGDVSEKFCLEEIEKKPEINIEPVIAAQV